MNQLRVVLIILKQLDCFEWCHSSGWLGGGKTLAGVTFIVLLFLTSPDAKLHTQLSRLHKDTIHKYTNTQGANTQIQTQSVTGAAFISLSDL